MGEVETQEFSCGYAELIALVGHQVKVGHCIFLYLCYPFLPYLSSERTTRSLRTKTVIALGAGVRRKSCKAAVGSPPVLRRIWRRGEAGWSDGSWQPR